MEYRNAIIIEGPDCSGKTTLANKIKEYYNNELDVVHCTGHDPRDYDFYKQLARKKNVVYDRHFVGETVYPIVFNREPELKKEEFEDLVKYTQENRIPVLVVAPPVEVLVSRLKAERPNEEVEVVNTITWARNEFYKAAQNNPSFILVKPEDGNIDFNYVIENIEKVYRGE